MTTIFPFCHPLDISFVMPKKAARQARCGEEMVREIFILTVEESLFLSHCFSPLLLLIT